MPERKLHRIIYLIGLHGAGKTTVGQAMQNNYGWRHISVGDLGRHARRMERVPGISIRLMAFLARSEPGVPLSNPAAQQLIAELESMRQFHNVVCDGFPSHPDNIDLLTQRSEIVLLKSRNSLREARLERRAVETSRRWISGMSSVRDTMVETVFSTASSAGFTSLALATDDQSIEEIASRLC